LRRALRKDPRERYQTAAAFRDAIGDYLYETGQRVGPPDLRAFVGDLFDDAPEALERLQKQALVVAPVNARAAAAAAAAAGEAAAELERSERTSTDAQDSTNDDGPTGEVLVDAAPMLTGPSRGLGGPAHDALTAHVALTDIDAGWPEDERKESSSVRGFTPISRPQRVPVLPFGTGGGPGKEVGRFVSGAPKRPPDSAGDVSVITPMRLFCDLAVAGETGLLRFELAGTVKEIFLVGGAPESVNSSLPSERFGEYLVGKGVLGQGDLDLTLSMLPHYNGKLGDTLVALGLLRPLDVFRLLSQQVRDRVIEVFGWTEGTFSFFRGVMNPKASFPLGLDTFEILGAGVVSLPAELLEQKFGPLLDYSPMATQQVRVQPEAFRIGPTPREVVELLDGQRTLRTWVDHFSAPEERLTFLRSLYLLVETDLAQLD
jgi:Domain of unknown function (DUF4388)